MNILVTGVNGFVGKHLVHDLIGSGHKVYGVGLSHAHPQIKELLAEYWSCDLTNPVQVNNLPLGQINGVISLAGLAKVGPSFDNPEQYKKVNVEILSVISERILNENLKIRILAVSTGAVYDANQPLPLTEQSGLIETGSPYAISKILMETKANKMILAGLDLVIARPFNHIGPGQEEGFLVPDLYKKMVIALNQGIGLGVGNLSTRRDYTDVRDVVSAYSNLITAPVLNYSLYNVCSGRSLAGDYILKLLLDASGITGRLKIETDESLVRPDDPKDLFGSFERLKQDTGWAPKISIQRTIKDFVEDKLENLSS